MKIISAMPFLLLMLLSFPQPGSARGDEAFEEQNADEGRDARCADLDQKWLAASVRFQNSHPEYCKAGKKACEDERRAASTEMQRIRQEMRNGENPCRN